MFISDFELRQTLLLLLIAMHSFRMLVYVFLCYRRSSVYQMGKENLPYEWNSDGLFG